MLGLGHRIDGRGNGPWLQLQAWPFVVVCRRDRTQARLDKNVADFRNKLTNGAHRGATTAAATSSSTAATRAGAGPFTLLVGIVVGTLAVTMPAEVVVTVAVPGLVAIAAFPLATVPILIALEPIIVVEVAVPTPVRRPICKRGKNWISNLVANRGPA